MPLTGYLIPSAAIASTFHWWSPARRFTIRGVFLFLCEHFHPYTHEIRPFVMDGLSADEERKVCQYGFYVYFALGSTNIVIEGAVCVCLVGCGEFSLCSFHWAFRRRPSPASSSWYFWWPFSLSSLLTMWFHQQVAFSVWKQQSSSF